MTVLSLLAFLGLANAKTIDFYVAPIKVQDYTREKEIEHEIDDQLAFTISSAYSRAFKVIDGGFHSTATKTFDEIRVFNDETIGYYYDCDYKKDPLKCAFENGHYFVETIVSIDDNELIVRVTMYDYKLQVVSSGYSIENIEVYWINQQEITHVKQTASDGSTTEMTSYPLEKLPLKWEIPHKLLYKHIRKATISMWGGVEIRLQKIP